jgi:hypothetical protein
MHLITPSPFRSPARLLGPVRLALFLMITATVPLPAAHVSATPPPHYPDRTHVFNGCRLSALAYLAKFTAEFPSEHGQPLVLSMRNADGQVRPHTLAVITWQGEWWCRDEYFGVFPLKCAADGASNPEQLTAIAERMYERHAQDVLRQPNAQLPPTVPAQLSPAQRLRDVQNATALIPVPHMIYWIRDGRREVPVMFFRPSAGEIAVYDPSFGTGTARCANTDDAKIVAVVAQRLGYRADSVRAEPAPLTGALVASSAFTSNSFSQ